MLILKFLKPPIFSFIILLFTVNIIFSQNYKVVHYSEQSGLNNSAVWSTLQDNEGKMWFGTKNGVSVYDGLNWNTYGYSTGGTGVDNIMLSKDEKGVVWVFARNTDVFISRFNGERFVDQIHSSYFSRSSITSFLVDTVSSKRFIFISGHLGEILYCYDTTWKTVILSEKTEINRVYSAIKNENSVLLATDKGLYNFTHEGIVTKINIDLPFVPKGLCFEEKNNEKRLLIGGGTIFGYIKNNTFIKLTDNLSLTYDENNPVLLIIPDRMGGYFLGNQFTLSFYSESDNSLMSLGIINGLIASGATSAFVDAETNIWITSLRGVSKISKRVFLNYRNAFQNYENEISSLIEYAPGKILFAGNYGLSFFDGSGYNYIKFLDTLGEETQGHIRILDLCKDKEENIWVAANVKGFFLVDKNFNFQKFKESPYIEGLATSVQQDEKGTIWLSTTRHIYSYTGKNLSIPDGFPYEINVRKIVKLKNNKLLFCAVGLGAYLKTDQGVKLFTAAENNCKNVFSAFEDSDGKVYLGTLGGLCIVKNDSIVKYTLNNNITIERPIYIILKDSENNFWFGTDMGVFRYDGSKLYSYTTKDGFAGNEVNRSAGIVDHMNRVWFGTNNGASCYYKEYDTKNDTSIFSPVFIKSINSQNKKTQNLQNLEFENSDNDITFLVSGTSFIDEKENKIRWLLEGFDNQWGGERPFVSNEIFYDNLSPGKYKLLVQMKNANGTWGPVTVSPEITINKPFYLRLWFVFICVIALGGVVYSVQHYFEQQKYNQALKKEIDRVTKELKATETNYRETLLKEIHHRVKNNMQIISSLLSLQSNRETDIHLSEIIKESQNRIRSMALIHEKLYQSKKFSSLDISSYVSSLIEYLKRVFLVNTAFIKVNLNIEETYINIDVAIACGLIINELVSNSFKYAFPNNSKGTIFIEILKQDKDTLFISVKDDGVGIKNLSGLDDTDSLGLKLVRMLVKQHRGNYNVSNNEGALFEIKLTLQNENIRE
ncbi:MAG: histidine kinase dimerization/phosphoacceptor domain -containing protein [Ignavibacteria bacterium]